MKIIESALMKDYTSFKVGGPAKRLIIVETTDELSEVLKDLDSKGEPFIFLGNGSNTLFTGKGYKGTVIKLGEAFSNIKVCGDKIVAGTAALMSKVARVAVKASLAGFEFASGIPGSLGGAVFMNAGAYDGQMADIVRSVKVISRDGNTIRIVDKKDLEFGYRHSIFHDTGEIALEVTLDLSYGNKAEIEDKLADLTFRRTSKQPLEYPSCGSFFKRPEGYFAGKLIQDSGLMGVSVGGAQVSDKHCGFLINKNNATAEDVLELKKLVEDTVFRKFGVRLEPEVRIIGEE